MLGRSLAIDELRTAAPIYYYSFSTKNRYYLHPVILMNGQAHPAYTRRPRNINKACCKSFFTLCSD